jgi:hypothetical protein
MPPHFIPHHGLAYIESSNDTCKALSRYVKTDISNSCLPKNTTLYIRFARTNNRIEYRGCALSLLSLPLFDCVEQADREYENFHDRAIKFFGSSITYYHCYLNCASIVHRYEYMLSDFKDLYNDHIANKDKTDIVFRSDYLTITESDLKSMIDTCTSVIDRPWFKNDEFEYIHFYIPKKLSGRTEKVYMVYSKWLNNVSVNEFDNKIEVKAYNAVIDDNQEGIHYDVELRF